MVYRPKRKIVACVLVGGLAIGVCTGYGVYKAIHHVPGFYTEVLVADRALLKKASDDLVAGVAALASDAHRDGAWRALFNEEQINGWLAVDLLENHAAAIPTGVSDPRVSIEENRLRLACRYDAGPVETIYSVDVDLYVVEPNVVAVHFRRARAGLLPMPLNRVMQAVAEGAQGHDLEVRWLHSGGDPIALLTVYPADNEGSAVWIDSLELHDGQIYLAGRREPREPPSPQPADDRQTPQLAAQPADDENENVQR